MKSDFSLEAMLRYSRTMIMADVGEEGQLAISKGKALVVGMGGLGSPVSMYLVAGGLGEIHIADDDVIDISNLPRQILYDEKDITTKKVVAAQKHLQAMNKSCKIVTYDERVNEQNVDDWIKKVDIVVDGSDNMESKLLLSAACLRSGTPFVFGAAEGWQGEVGFFWPQAGEGSAKVAGTNSCLGCLYGADYAVSSVVSRCDVIGVWGAVVGVIGSMQALRVFQWLVDKASVQRGYLYVFDGKRGKHEEIRIPKDAACHFCGSAAIKKEKKYDR